MASGTCTGAQGVYLEEHAPTCDATLDPETRCLRYHILYNRLLHDSHRIHISAYHFGEP